MFGLGAISTLIMIGVMIRNVGKQVIKERQKM